MSYLLEMHEQFDCSRSPKSAFNYIVDFSRIDEWDHTVVSAKKSTDGEIAEGSEFDLVLSSGLRKIPIHYTVTEFNSPTHAVLTGKAQHFTAIDTVTIKDTPNGCHVDWHARIEFSGFAAKVIPMLEKKVVAVGRKTIRDLKTALDDNFAAPSQGFASGLADKLIAPGLFKFTKFGYQKAKKTWQPISADITDKHIVITGPTSGLGLATAKELASMGAELTLVARDKSKVERIAQEISQQTGNQKLNIEVCDLSLMQDVSQLADRLLKKGQVIEVLINNAGALFNTREETSEGLEKSFALLLLGPYLLTEKLAQLLKQSDEPRVINVSSGGMYATRLSVSNLESTKGEYRGADAYARSKRGLVIIGEEWAKHWAEEGVTVHNMHPGWAQTPGVVSSLPSFEAKTRKVLRTPEQGADTIIWLASATEVSQTTGLFWLDREPHNTHLTNKTRETKEQRQALLGALEDCAKPYL